jgi:hypothetical protein
MSNARSSSSKNGVGLMMCASSLAFGQLAEMRTRRANSSILEVMMAQYCYSNGGLYADSDQWVLVVWLMVHGVAWCCGEG